MPSSNGLQCYSTAELRSVLQDVTFNEKGQIFQPLIKEASADDTDWKVANDYATDQVVNENMITLFLKHKPRLPAKHCHDAQGQKAMITSMLDQFKTGIPVHVSYPAANKVYLYVDKDFVAPIIAMLYAQVYRPLPQVWTKDDLAQFHGFEDRCQSAKCHHGEKTDQV